MAKKKSLIRAEFTAGIFLVLCLGIFAGMLLVYGKLTRFWEERVELKVYFGSVDPVGLDSPVSFNGKEIGKVKAMRVIQLDARTLARLLPLKKDDLEALPFSAEERLQLNDVPGPDFDRKCREALKDKTMIELTLELFRQDDYRGSRVDDAVHIASNMMGTARIEIFAGSGPLLGPAQEVALLGQHGDVFSKLSRSMEEVRRILNGVSDVVGDSERQNFMQATARFSRIMQSTQDLSKTARERGARTMARFKEVDQAGAKTTQSFGLFIEQIQPDARRVGDGVRQAREALGKRFGDLMKGIDGAEADLKAGIKPVAADIAAMTAASKPDIERIKEELFLLIQRAGAIRPKVQGLSATLALAVEQSLPEFERLAESFKNSVENLLPLRYIRERIGEIIGKRDLGEHEFYTALDTYDRLRRIARWPGDTLAQLATLREWIARGDAVWTPVALDRIDQLAPRLGVLAQEVGDARRVAEEALCPPFTGAGNPSARDPLPPFPRKKGGLPEDPALLGPRRK